MADDTADSRPNIFPELIYSDAPAALEWLAQAFGFTQGELIPGPAGTIAHAEMHFGAGTIMLKSPVPQSEFGMSPGEFGMSPRALGGINQSLYVAVEDPDAHFERAKSSGAEILIEPMDTDFGARIYVTRDVEGHLWSFGNYRPRRESR
jgi:uncharacterized glyoxalase superfamily protein PhnB